jgi:RHS repeat-associated protein
VTWTLDPNGNRTTLAWPETGALAFSTSYAYDAMNRLTDVFQGAASAGVLLGHYSYDALSERTGIAFGGTTAAGGSRPPVATTAASFTTAGQIAQLSHGFNGAALSLGYSYNQDHQRTGVSTNDASFLVSGLTPGNHVYTANNLNQYDTVDGQGYIYDTNGNLVRDTTFIYGYDSESRLVSATAIAVGGTTASYAYDPQGRRKAKTVNGTTTNYLSAGSREIAEYDGSGTLLRRYVYGPGLDEPLATIDAAGNISYHFTDALGSVVALANASGQLAEKHAYTAYGLAASTAGTAFQFTGRRVDPETGLYYLRARYYSPAIGRFLQTDPIGTAGGINLYAYVGNDPVNRMDPFGLATFDQEPPATLAATPDMVQATMSAAPDLGPALGSDVAPTLVADRCIAAAAAGCLAGGGAGTEAGLALGGGGGCVATGPACPAGALVGGTGGAIIGGAIGCGLGGAGAYAACNSANSGSSGGLTKNQCIEICSDLALPTQDFGIAFQRCMNQCLALLIHPK